MNPSVPTEIVDAVAIGAVPRADRARHRGGSRAGVRAHGDGGGRAPARGLARASSTAARATRQPVVAAARRRSSAAPPKLRAPSPQPPPRAVDASLAAPDSPDHRRGHRRGRRRDRPSRRRRRVPDSQPAPSFADARRRRGAAHDEVRARARRVDRVVERDPTRQRADAAVRRSRSHASTSRAWAARAHGRGRRQARRCARRVRAVAARRAEPRRPSRSRGRHAALRAFAAGRRDRRAAVRRRRRRSSASRAADRARRRASTSSRSSPRTSRGRVDGARATSRSTTTSARSRPARSPERRRTVVVARHARRGAAPRCCGRSRRSLGELAYQRGGVVLELDDDALVVAFGLEVAGEDDVAIAMGWALDAAAMARDAGAAEHGASLALRIGARTGVADRRRATAARSRPMRSTRRARSRARRRPIGRCSSARPGRMTSGLYALREVPAPRRIARRSKVIEVVGPRGFDERDRARLERRGKFVGRTRAARRARGLVPARDRGRSPAGRADHRRGRHRQEPPGRRARRAAHGGRHADARRDRPRRARRASSRRSRS